MKVENTIYIPSKGRADVCTTPRLLLNSGLPFYLVVEPQDHAAYVERWGAKRCLQLDKSNMGVSYVRNWMKRHSIAAGHAYHWQVDDNIRDFSVRSVSRKSGGITTRRTDPAFVLGVVEKYVQQFRNVAQAGPRYNTFVVGTVNQKAVLFNKQVCSCYLSCNAVPVWWRTDIVEDTDYSLQLLQCEHRRWCTVLFNRLYISKTKTMVMKGGCTEVEYGNDGRYRRALGLVRAWPGCFRAVRTSKGIRVLPSRVWSKFKQEPK